MKMTNETRKIWGDDSILAAATCIRVPVMRAHAEAINLELAEDIEEEEARDILAEAPGVSLIDDRRAISALARLSVQVASRCASRSSCASGVHAQAPLRQGAIAGVTLCY
jgi:aspartate-semialdehyde dehydrogenase